MIMSNLESLNNSKFEALSDKDMQDIAGGRKWTEHLGHSELDGQTVDYWVDCSNGFLGLGKTKYGDAYETHD